MNLRRSDEVKVTETPGGNTTFTLVSVNTANQLGMIRQRQVPGGKNPFHTHSCEEVMVQFAGSVTVQMNDEVVVLHPGDVLVIPPDTLHQIENTGSEEAEWLLAWPAGVRFYKADGEEMQPAWATV